MHLLIGNFPVQFLAASRLTEEAVREAKPVQYESVPAKVFRPEYIIAIAASVGRHKDFARIEQMFDQVKNDKALLDDILVAIVCSCQINEIRIRRDLAGTVSKQITKSAN